MINIKKIFFFILFLMLFIPFIQESFDLIKLKPLKGYFIIKKRPTLTKRTWLTGKYQDSLSDYIENTIGLRPFFVRLNNQIDYKLFNHSVASGVIIGKDNVLFQEGYINALWGNDYIGDTIINHKIVKLAFIQEKLKEQDKYLIFLLAPGKASIYEDKIPSQYFKKPKTISNYEVCVREMKKYHINLIDMRSYFMQLKDKSPYPLFPKCGTHWSGYGITLVADTLFKYIEKISGFDLVDFHAEKGEITSTKLRYTDNDIGEGMNLLWDIPNYPVYYPKIVFEADSTKKKPALLGIGDSFGQSFWGFYPYFDNLFNNKTQYWSYFKLITWPDELAWKNIQIEDIDLRFNLKKYDIILIVSTEQNLANFDFGFIEKVYPILKENIDEFESKIQGYIYTIRQSPEWFNIIRKKSIKGNVPLEEMIRNDAIWMAKNDKKDVKTIFINK
jgi:hypothetical protein